MHPYGANTLTLTLPLQCSDISRCTFAAPNICHIFTHLAPNTKASGATKFVRQTASLQCTNIPVCIFAAPNTKASGATKWAKKEAGNAHRESLQAPNCAKGN